jgi:hypothetical protein
MSISIQQWKRDQKEKEKGFHFCHRHVALPIKGDAEWQLGSRNTAIEARLPIHDGKGHGEIRTADSPFQ